MAQASPMAVAIEGLSKEQCDLLQGIKKGSLIEVAVFTKPKERAARSDGEDEGDGSEDGDEASDVESQDVEERASEGEEDVSEPNEPDTPDAMEQATSALATKQPVNGIIPGSRSYAAQPRYLDGHLPGRNSNHASDADHFEDVSTGANGVGADTSSPDTNGANNAASGAAAANGQEPNGAAEGTINGDDESDGEGSNDEDQEDGQDDEEGEGEDGSDEADEDGDEYEPPKELERALYVVLNVTTKEDGEDSTITDVHLRQLHYQDRGDESDYDTYRIYGNVISVHDPSATRDDDEEPISFADMVTSKLETNFITVLHPSGDHIRRTIHGRTCPARCTRGWLAGRTALKELVDDQLQRVRHYRPLCPVCIGKDLMNEQIVLRGILDTMHIVDIGMVVEYLGRLNPRRRQLGYSFLQFDEREWGYAFDDMIDEFDADGDGGDGARFEQWEEAMDPNANPKTRPAPVGTIAALPRKTFAEVAEKKKGACCPICQGDAFVEESKVVELPCGHVYDEECLEEWIGQYDNCPECRATVSGMVEAKEEIDDGDGEAGRQENEEKGNGAHLATPAPAVNGEQEASVEPEMDGDDMVMSDAN